MHTMIKDTIDFKKERRTIMDDVRKKIEILLLKIIQCICRYLTKILKMLSKYQEMLIIFFAIVALIGPIFSVIKIIINFC